jgi:hypothetical protein
MPVFPPGYLPGKSPFHVKGVVYRNFFDYVGEALEDGRSRVLAALPDEPNREFAAQPFLAGSFYDTLPTVTLCEAAAGLVRQPFAQFVRGFSQYTVERDTKGVYRMLLKLVSPHMVMERTPAAAKQYFDFVEASVEKTGPKSYHTVSRGVPELMAAFYMLVTESFLTHALALAGARQPRHRWLGHTPDGNRGGFVTARFQREISWQ